MFKVPQTLPQDLLLIQDLVADLCVPTPASEDFTEDIDSSGSDSDSSDEVEEIEVNLLIEDPKPNVPSSDSDPSPDSDSDSDSDHSDDMGETKAKPDHPEIHDDDEDSGVPTPAYFQTKNEIIEVDIMVPDIEEVGPEEELQIVGEVLSIVDNVVILRGTPTEIAGRGAESVLDSGTLLVFEDRKVLGYIYETFGPTSQPLYQVKFNSKYPLDPEKVQISRRVFHIPQRSNFVILGHIIHLKGSDASNVHDEEPADEELEFSDDEQEAAFKSTRKRKRGDSRAYSAASSRHSTPTPSQMRDQDLVDNIPSCINPYDAHGPYDMDLGVGPFRAPPIPYDDPYSDDFGIHKSSTEQLNSPQTHGTRNQEDNRPGVRSDFATGRVSTPNRGRGRGLGRQDKRYGSGWGGNTPGPGGRGKGTRDSRHSNETSTGWPDRQTTVPLPEDQYDPRVPRPCSPTSLAIARATGQFTGGSSFGSHNQAIPQGPSMLQASEVFFQPHQPQHHPFSFISQGYQQQYVQPHINPRFACNFGMSMGFMQPTSPPRPQHGQYGHPAGSNQTNWTDEWTVHTSHSDGATTEGSHDGSGKF